MTSSALTETCTQTQYQAADGSCLPQNVENCKLYTAYTNNCLVCKTGFYAANGLCSPQNLSNCDVYQANQNLCQTCAAGYFVNGFNVCVAQSAPNCATYVLNRNKCASCVEPLVLVNGECTQTQTTSCAMYANDNISCVLCVTGYYVSNGACLVQSVVNCAAYQPNQNLCISCQPGYYLNQGRCDQAWVARCMSYAPNQNYCLICMAGNYAFNGACLAQNADNCRSFTANTNLCNFCLTGYYPVNGVCTAQSLPNCQTYVENENKCQGCASGWVLNNGICIQATTIPNCSVAQDRICVTCQTNYYVLGGVCYLQSVPNCKVYKPNENVCQTCFDGYMLAGGVCVGPPSNCQDLFPNTNICQICVTGYYSLNGACFLQKIPNCSIYIPNNNLCGTCETGYVLYNGVCNVYSPVQNCLIQVFNGCQTCSPGFYLADNTCVIQNLTGCSKYADNKNVCLECTASFALQQGICWLLPLNCLEITVNGGIILCSKCDALSVLSNGKCYAQVPNCLTYEGAACVACVTGFTISNGQCYSNTAIANCLISTNSVCSFCQAGFYLENNACLAQSVANCDQYQRNVNSCMACKTGFLLNNGLCNAPQLTCAQYDTTGTVCYVCFAGFYPLNGVCIPQDVPNCADYYFSTNLCYQCASGYSLINYVCVANSVIPNCQTISGPTCLACITGYYLANNACSKQDKLNCSTYVANTNDCSKCIAGYFLNVGSCYQIPANCKDPIVVNSNAVCVTCLPTYYPSNNECLAQNVNNCKTYLNTNSNQCLACVEGYNLNNNACLPPAPIANCKSQNLLICNSCNDGFYLIDNACKTQTVANCLQHYPNVNLCQNCENGYTQVNGACKKNPANCMTIQTVNNELICAYCNTGYYLDNASCYVQKIDNCATYYPNVNTCSGCATGYSLLANVCYQIPANCKQIGLLNGKTICSFCITGYYPDPQGVCIGQNVQKCSIFEINTNICLKCEVNFSLTAGNTCEASAAIPNCATQEGTICKACISGFYLSNNICLAQDIANCDKYTDNSNNCIACKTGYQLFVNACWATPLGCNGYTFADGVVYCAACQANFYLENGFCKPQNTPNCFKFADGSNVCLQCITDYVLFNGFCVKMPDNCLSIGFSADGIICQTCATGFVPINGICVASTIENCIEYNNQGACLKCGPRFFLSEGACESQSLPNCEAYVENLNLCTKCTSPYVLVAALCQMPPLNCLSYSVIPGGLVCDICNKGFYLAEGAVCQQQKVLDCLTYVDNKNVCVACNKGFYISEGSCLTQSLANCAIYVDNQNLCQECKSPAVAVAGLCKIPPENCATYTTIPGGLVCQICNKGFYLTQNSGCLAQSVADCLEYKLNENICSKCQPDFVLEGNTCVKPTIGNCKTYSADGKTCEVCNSPYVVLNGQCVMPPSNCAEYSSTTGSLVCTKCNSGFFLNNASCEPQSLVGCKTYAVNLNLCEVCEATYVLVAGLCQLPPANCDKFVTVPGGLICQTCAKGYFLNNASNCEAQKIADCSAYVDNQNVCSTCAVGFYLDKNACLAQNVADCKTHVSNINLCQECNPGFVVNQGACLKQDVANCFKYVLNSSVCQECLAEYVLIDGACKPWPLNCDKYLTTGAVVVCEICKAGFFAADGVCVPVNVSKCISYTLNTNICLECEADYNLVNNVCVYQLPIANCEVQANGICSKCLAGYFLVDNVCYKQDITGCNRYVDRQNLCLGCDSPYILSVGLCVMPPANCKTYQANLGGFICTECNPKFYPLNGVCTSQSVQDCVDYVANQNVCSKCADGFLLQNGACVSPTPIANCQTQTLQTCSLCNPKFFLVDNTCQAQSLTGCLEFISNQNVCSKCDNGYLLEAGACVQPAAIANCQTQILETCSLCNPKFYLINNTCLPQDILNCLEFVSNQNVCSKCADGFLLQNGACVKPTAIENCQTQTLETCSLCNPKFYLINNTCLPQSLTGCFEYVSNQNVCSKCSEGFTLGGGLCFLVPLSCKTYTASASGLICTDCNSGFYLSGDSCLTQDVLHCLEYVVNQNVCSKCIDGYTLKDNVCTKDTPIVNPIADCADQVDTVCRACKSGFYLLNNACVKQDVLNCQLFVLNSPQCLICAQNYELSGNSCLPVPDKCKSYNIEATRIYCTDCLINFYAEEGICKSQSMMFCDLFILNKNLCERCVSEFYPANGGASCEPQDLPNCSSYVDQQNVCSVCNVEAQLINGNCYIPPANCGTSELINGALSCVTCDKGFYASSGACADQNVAFCSIFQDNTNICTKCADGYQLINNGAACQGSVDVNCATLNIDGTCKICNPKYYVNEGVCLLQDISGCGVYIDNENVCQACADGYNFDFDGVCQTIPDPNCFTQVPNSSLCQVCLPGFYISNGKCLTQNVDQCASYETNLNVCLICNFGFYLTPAKACETQNVPNCLLHNDNENTCNICDFGFNPSQGLCISTSQSDLNCAKYDSDVCLECKTGYYLNLNACFVQNIPLCSTYEVGQNVCKTCSGSNVLSLGRCYGPTETPVTIQNCFRQTGTTCSFCDYGYFWDAASSSCVATVESGVAFSYTENGTKKYIYLTYTPDFTGFMFAGSTDIESIFGNSIIRTPIAPEGKYYTLRYDPELYLAENANKVIEIFYNPQAGDTQAQWEMIPGTAPYTFTIKNAKTGNYLQGCCTTGTAPVIFTIASVDGFPPA
jgi:hypothetical protein